MKDHATSTLSAIAVGDMVMVQGTVNGTSVTATKINDGMMMNHMGKGGGAPMQSPQAIQGNGEPVVGGTISALSGSTITLTNASNVTYSVDASAATVFKDNATSSISSLATGDKVIVQGTVNGTTVTASSVIDQGASSTPAAGTSMPHQAPGVFGAIGGFFHKMFGFF